MAQFNDGKPYHGSEEVTEGKLKGATGETDYFYFFCPRCAGRKMLRILDYGEHEKKAKNEYDDYCNSKSSKGFTLVLKIHCEFCGFEDFVKISNMGWQGGDLNV